jgi:hypothetical protein
VKLGIVLGTSADLRHAAALALAARRARHEVAIFAMDAGCAALADGVVRGSQDDHAAVVGTSDRLIALT